MLPLRYFRILLTRLTQTMEPLAFKFFNPLVDMEVTARPVEPADMPSTRVNPNFNEFPRTVQPHGFTSASRLQRQLPGSPSLGPGSYRMGQSSSASTPLKAGGPIPSHNTPSAVENILETNGSTSSYEQSTSTRLQRQSSFLRPSTNPTNHRASGIATTSATTLQRRKSLHEDIEAQRGTFHIRLLFNSDRDDSARDNRRGLSVEREYGGVH
jgi:hypothetical protein